MAFMRVRGGDSSDIVSAVVLHRFQMRRKKKKKKKKNLSKCPCGAKFFFVRRRGACARGKLDVKGKKDLHFFLRGGTKYSERWWWLACTREAHKGWSNRVVGVPQMGDMMATEPVRAQGEVVAVVLQLTLSCTSSR